MRKLTVFVCLLILSLSICGCDSFPVSPSGVLSSAGSSSEADLEENEDQADSEETKDQTEAQEKEESVVIDVEKAEEEFLEVLDACAGVWPGTAGSSLRGIRAAGMLLDWSETYADLLSTDQIELFAENWTDSCLEEDLANLYEAWESVAYSAREMAEDPLSEAELLEDAGYQLLYSEYHADAVEIVIETIENLYFGEMNGEI